ncbi:MAG: hypothetical protein LBC93_04595 [Synergistaceae bacterium]|jgi:hypothetical protein|nr:hypothetical protein [Synergistaceae bacterium]
MPEEAAIAERTAGGVSPLRAWVFFAVFLFQVWGWRAAADPVPGAVFFSLPPEWEVISQDEPAERSERANAAYSVRQVLYARTALGGGAALQVFSIWSTSEEGEALPLPGGVTLGEELLAGLLYARYGQAARLEEGAVRVGSEAFAVATYGVGAFRVERSPKGEIRFWRVLRYKCASLFWGEQLFLLSMKYLPKHEDYWQRQLETLLSAWSASLPFTAGPVFEQLETPVLAAATPSIPDVRSLEASEEPEDEEPEDIEELDFYGKLAFSVSVVFFMCSGGLFIRRRRRERAQSHETEFHEAQSDETEPDSPASGEATPKDAILPEQNRKEPPAEGNFPLPSAPRKEAAPEKNETSGFDKVYTLLGQALNTIEGIGTKGGGSGKPLPPPGLEEAIGILEGLEKRFGPSFIMKTMKGEVLKTLVKTPPPSRNMTQECCVLKLCCGVLVNMVRTGRYHVGKGILSSEGQELAALFTRLNEARALESCGSPEELDKDAAFMRFCVREKG